jgi:predicted HAD superfamily phosphohydrolase YqeG
MGELNQHQVRSILDHLDQALVSLRGDDVAPGLESNAAWRVRMARELLVSAAVRPVKIAMLEAA